MHSGTAALIPAIDSTSPAVNILSQREKASKQMINTWHYVGPPGTWIAQHSMISTVCYLENPHTEQLHTTESKFQLAEAPQLHDTAQAAPPFCTIGGRRQDC